MLLGNEKVNNQLDTTKLDFQYLYELQTSTIDIVTSADYQKL